jgi:acyl-CoA reductase-like NAD-dependent aldehyde dehydrogenase
MREARRMFPTVGSSPDYTAIISPRHFDRLAAAVEEARRRGAKILTHADADAEQQRKIGPTVVLDPPTDSLLMREEIFGPVLPIISYGDLDEVIAQVNDRARPLALYCLTHDTTQRARIMEHTVAGGVTLNGTLLHIGQEDLPFGGVGASGIGAYHGFEVRGLNPFDLLTPPYGRRFQTIVRVLFGR